MANTVVIDLGQSTINPALDRMGIRFLRAEVFPTATGISPLVIVYYEEDGNQQRLGLRLDLNKRVFLDHVDDPDKDVTVVSSAAATADAVLARVASRP